MNAPEQQPQRDYNPPWKMDTWAGRNITQPLAQPVSEYFQNQRQEAQQGWNQAAQGVHEVGDDDLLKGAKDFALGAMGWGFSPYTAMGKAIADQAVRRPLGDDETWKRYLANAVDAIGTMFGPGGAARILKGGAEAVGGLLPKAGPEMAQTLSDFDATHVTPTLPAVTQNKTAGKIAQSLSQVPFVGEKVVSAAAKNLEESATEARRVATLYSNAARPEEAGEALQQGYDQFKGKDAAPVDYRTARLSPTRDIGFIPKSDALFGNIPIPDETTAQLPNTMGKLDDLLERYGSNPQFQKFMENTDLSKIRTALKGEPAVYGPGNIIDPATGKPAIIQLEPAKPGGLSWGDLKDFRSEVGQWMRDPPAQLGVGRDEWRHLYGAISDDMKATADSVSPQARQAFDQATSYYRTGLDRLNNVLSFIDKSASNEKAFSDLSAMASERGKIANIVRLERAMKSMPDEFKNDVASTMINRLGLAKPSAAGATPEAFSLSTFSTNYSNISERAKNAIFGPVGSDRRDALDTLSRVVNKLQNVERLANPSGTWRGEAGSGIVGALVVAPVTTTKALLVGNVLSRALVSPRLTRWLINGARARTLAAQAAQQQALLTMTNKVPAAAALYDALYGGPKRPQ
ncbi:MAG: hypothetical protein KGL39_04065 [Patescibacteria group bacterium]|nr:hypothetical protein [Patescibacteria group bacterium]